MRSGLLHKLKESSFFEENDREDERISQSEGKNFSQRASELAADRKVLETKPICMHPQDL